MTRSFLISLLSVVMLALVATFVPFGGSSTGSGSPSLFGVNQAEAQQRKRKSLFKLLFERQKKRIEKREQKRKATTRTLKRQKATTKKASRSTTKKNRKKVTTRNASVNKTRNKKRSTSAAAVKKPEVAVVKRDDAKKILVLGDFMASAVARGLERQYVGLADIVVINNTKPDSGIVRDDVIDWPTRMPALIEEHKPVAVLVLLGMNDRQQMRLETGRAEKLSEEWTKAYRDRITAITKAGMASSVPFLWVGLPPVKSGRMNTDYLAFNEMYRSIVEASEGTFVDVWDGFTNAEGKFVSAGPDINGRIVRLRGKKGITMTRAGRSKIAFFADKVLRKLGIVGTPQELEFAGLGAPDTSGGGQLAPNYDPAKTGKTVVISLGAPTLDGGKELEGSEGFLKAKDDTESVSFNLVNQGELPSPQPGRIDAGWGVPSEIELAVTEPSGSGNGATPQPVLRGSTAVTENPQSGVSAPATSGNDTTQQNGAAQ